MGRKENIKRMKRLRAEKKTRQEEIEKQSELDTIAEEATDKLIEKLSPFEKIKRNIGPVKYSEVLKDFVGPYLDECRDFHDTKALVNAGAIAWNIASIKQFGGETAYASMIKNAKKELKVAEGIDLLEELVDRKIKYFSNHRITFHNVELTENKTAFGISVAVEQIDSGL